MKNIYMSGVLVTIDLSVFSDIYRSFIPNKSTFTKYCLTQWISKKDFFSKIVMLLFFK